MVRQINVINSDALLTVNVIWIQLENHSVDVRRIAPIILKDNSVERT
jgi:hypothetical protein